ncbi:MAG: response regulator [Pseudomonadota bacterium]|nr:response regulator [Pseudomonadota bacterium]
MVTQAPMRVLVVEDEAMVAMLVEDILLDLGHVVVGPAMRLDEAVPLARQGEFDIAILDVNLGTARSYPVADLLRDQGIPFVFATGYGSAGLEDAYRGLTLTLKKPFGAEDVRRAFQHVRPPAASA